MFKLTKANITKLIKAPLEVLKSLDEDDIASIIQQANHSYYNEKQPVFSDNIYDMIKDYLEEKNPAHPILKHVGAAVEDRKEPLPYYMGSLDKIKGEIDKFKKKYPGSYLVSDKLDGNSGLFTSIKGQQKLYSRGDGKIGQNASHVIPFIQGIPSNIKEADIAIRGEIIISKQSFDKLKAKGANARNMVAGMLNAKVPDLQVAKATQFIAYEVISPKMEPADQIPYMKKLGFQPVHSVLLQEDQLTNTKLSDILTKRREESPFEIDGIVVMHNKQHNRVTEGNPPYGFAFKSIHTMAKAEVIVQSVEWNISKDGYLVPTVLFGSVALGGVSIQRATGFNAKFISDNKIGPGSKIVIMRSGDVIPYIHQVLNPSETGEPQMPDAPYVWNDTEVNIMIPDEHKKDNDELQLKNLEHFIKKIEVVGLGPGNIKKMFQAGFTTPKSIFAATAKDLLKVDGFQAKTAEKVYAAIQEKNGKLSCLQLMEASNTLGRGLGGKKLELITEAFPTILSNRYVPTVTELINVKGVEKTTANLFISNLPHFFKFIDDNKLTDACSKEAAPVVVAVAGPSGTAPTANFSGKKFVFTGFRNKEWEQAIKSMGGDVSSSVSKNTTLVIAKDVNEDSTKITAAKKHNIPVISIDQFKKDYMQGF